jgi:hypothetical protein
VGADAQDDEGLEGVEGAASATPAPLEGDVHSDLIPESAPVSEQAGSEEVARPQHGYNLRPRL